MTSKTTYNLKPLAAAVGSILAAGSPAALAQDTGEDAVSIEEIVVTATRREASVQDIPYNISAVRI